MSSTALVLEVTVVTHLDNEDNGSCEEDGPELGIGYILLISIQITFRILCICADYIDEVFEGPSLWPSDPYKKAVDRLILEEFGSKVCFMKLFSVQCV